MNDEELKQEYRALMDQAQEEAKRRHLGDSWHATYSVLCRDPSERVQCILGAMKSRRLPGVGHEDGRYDYICSSPRYCRCSS